MANFYTGLEMEMFTLNKKGQIVFEGEKILKQVKKADKNIWAMHECGKHMIEFGVKPSKSITQPFKVILKHLKTVIEIAMKNNILLFPFGTYPGEFDPRFNKNIMYRIKEKVLGEDKFKIAGLCIGYHMHLSLPKSSFSKKKMVKVAQQNINDALINGYNLLIAADPVVTTFMQSSPFIQGKYLAKDSRMLFYRGGENLKFEGLYSNFQLFGGLQSYIQTITDVIKLVEKRYDLWLSAVSEKGFDPNLIRKYGKKLDFAWNPVKVNKKGTLEQRGMDMNLPSYSLAVTTLLQNAFARIRTEGLEVRPSDHGINEPFRQEGKTLIIPPIDHVQEVLQYNSAMHGLGNKGVLKYCDRFVKFAMKNADKNTKILIKRVKEMLKSKKTMSDILIEEVKNAGGSVKRKLPKKISETLALNWCYKLMKDIQFTEYLLKKAKV